MVRPLKLGMMHLAFALPDFYKGANKDAIMEIGNIEPNMINKPIHVRASR